MSNDELNKLIEKVNKGEKIEVNPKSSTGISIEKRGLSIEKFSIDKSKKNK